jgi:starvation-inducible outer membrane lipoprotein
MKLRVLLPILLLAGCATTPDDPQTRAEKSALRLQLLRNQAVQHAEQEKTNREINRLIVNPNRRSYSPSYCYTDAFGYTNCN